ncbi:hypothetical protein G7Z17_g7586 [Cylindrodendrum hubeiense]|uniref:Uncharacterized protein n=1 Tax=Cylindrodendrum hubeiense TaxID=595255 RepID=A0A9P5H820_9HYPO|nr:hypothetical protein G7Z17_g7586 [Cylindrodendrum hubeiense]
MVLIYHPPDIFQDPRNYDFGPLDDEMTRVASIGAVACLQFEDRLDTYQDFATPELFQKIGYILADRYGNGNGFAYKNILSLIELYPEPDMYTSHLDKTWYIPYFECIEGFARGAQQANQNVGVGAVGANRMYYCADKMPESPFHSEFYKFIKERDVPIKAITFHWVTPFSQNPEDLVVTCKSIIAQDADVEQCLPWVGAGYGFFGGGNAWFEAYYEKNTDRTQPDILNPLGAAWQISGRFLNDVKKRLPLQGCDNNFAGLAGVSEDGKTIEILLCNYQFSDALLKELNGAYIKAMDTDCGKWNKLDGTGLLDGEYYAFKSPPAPPGLSLSGPRPSFCQNKTANYDLCITELPWAEDIAYSGVVYRINDARSLHEHARFFGTGKEIKISQASPPSSMDLIVITIA